MIWLSAILSAITLPIVIWNLLLLLEVLSAALQVNRGRESLPSTAVADVASYVVLIPAHDEAEIIVDNLKTLLNQLSAAGRILVVADNCTDDTARLVRACGVEVIERKDPDRRGKGFALQFGLRHLALATPDVIVIMDADCNFGPGDLQRVVDHTAKHRHPVQCDYAMTLTGNENLPRRISHFAWRLKNGIRPRGLKFLGLPCQLTGTGMAFPGDCIREVDIPASSIVEDVELGLNLAARWHFPEYFAGGIVTSEFPDDPAAEQSQRNRWEHGHLATIVKVIPSTFFRSLRDKNFLLALMCLDLSVPPITLLAALTVAITTTMLLGYWWLGIAVPLVLTLLSTVMLTISSVSAWCLCARDLIRPSELLGLTLHVVRKLGIYKGFVRKRQVEWIRTARK